LTGIASIPNGKFFRFAQDMGLFSASKIRTAEPKKLVYGRKSQTADYFSDDPEIWSSDR
jgi:hypothetical protein